MNETCCEVIGGKVLQGRAQFREELVAGEAFLQQIHVEMEQLSGESRAVEKRTFYLELHKPATSSCYRNWKLRWRLTGERNGHTDWEGVAMRMERISVAQRRYYEGINERMLELNVLETIARTQAKWLREHLEQVGEIVSAEASVFQRRVFIA